MIARRRVVMRGPDCPPGFAWPAGTRVARAHAAQVVLEYDDVVSMLGEPTRSRTLVCVDACRPVAAVDLGGKGLHK